MNMPVPAPASRDSVSAVDLDAYFARIGYDGPRTPTIETLRALHALHPAAIVFEAIDVMLGRGVDLDPAVVDAKLIQARRGGYCFEHNGLFKRVLTTLGFEVEGLAARVRWNQPPDAPPLPSTHMALLVVAEGQAWLTDVGFGGCVMTAPLRLNTNAVQETAHDVFRFAPDGACTRLEALIDGDWQPLYVVSHEPQLDVDYELRNWYTSTHPNSHFRHNLMVARTTPQARYTLRNNRYTVRRPGGAVDQRTLDADQIARVLVETFELPVEPDWQALIERVVAKS